MIKTASQPTPMNSLAIKPCSKKSSMRYHILPVYPAQTDVGGERNTHVPRGSARMPAWPDSTVVSATGARPCDMLSAMQ